MIEVRLRVTARDENEPMVDYYADTDEFAVTSDGRLSIKDEDGVLIAVYDTAQWMSVCKTEHERREAKPAETQFLAPSEISDLCAIVAPTEG